MQCEKLFTKYYHSLKKKSLGNLTHNSMKKPVLCSVTVKEASTKYGRILGYYTYLAYEPLLKTHAKQYSIFFSCSDKHITFISKSLVLICL